MSDLLKFELHGGVAVFLEEGDITRQHTDAIVNAANSTLMGGGGVDGAIHRAGGPAILAECRKIVAEQGHLPPGQAVSTTGGKLPAAFVIHTVGPIYRDGMQGEAGLLASCYRECLRLAGRLHLETIAFPSISTGAYGYPLEDAAEVALRTVFDELEPEGSVREVRFVLFSEHAFETYAAAGRQILKARPGFATVHTIHLPPKHEHESESRREE